MNARHRSLVVLLALAFLLSLAEVLPAQCAMCKEALDNEKATGNSGLADGISMSILFMLSLPLTIAGGFSFALWRAYKKAEQSA